MNNLSWGRFERFALDGPEREWVAILFWPQALAEIALLIAYPIREWYYSRPPRIIVLNLENR